MTAAPTMAASPAAPGLGGRMVSTVAAAIDRMAVGAARFVSASARHGRGPAAAGYDELREAYRVHSPLAHAARVARERLLILAARGDRVVPAEHPRWLEAHWKGPRIVWFSGSHLAPVGRGTALAAIRRFLGEIDVPPAS